MLTRLCCPHYADAGTPLLTHVCRGPPKLLDKVQPRQEPEAQRIPDTPEAAAELKTCSQPEQFLLQPSSTGKQPASAPHQVLSKELAPALTGEPEAVAREHAVETAAQPGQAQAVAEANEGATSAQLAPAEAVATAFGNGIVAQPGLAETAPGLHGMGIAAQATTETAPLCHDPASGSAEAGNPAAPDAAQDSCPAETLLTIPVPGAAKQPAIGTQEADLLPRCPLSAGGLNQRPSMTASRGKAEGEQHVQAAGKAPDAVQGAGLPISWQSPAAAAEDGQLPAGMAPEVHSSGSVSGSAYCDGSQHPHVSSAAVSQAAAPGSAGPQDALMAEAAKAEEQPVIASPRAARAGPARAEEQSARDSQEAAQAEEQPARGPQGSAGEAPNPKATARLPPAAPVAGRQSVSAWLRPQVAAAERVAAGAAPQAAGSEANAVGTMPLWGAEKDAVPHRAASPANEPAPEATGSGQLPGSAAMQGHGSKPRDGGDTGLTCEAGAVHTAAVLASRHAQAKAAAGLSARGSAMQADGTGDNKGTGPVAPHYDSRELPATCQAVLPHCGGQQLAAPAKSGAQQLAAEKPLEPATSGAEQPAVSTAPMLATSGAQQPAVEAG